MLIEQLEILIAMIPSSLPFFVWLHLVELASMLANTDVITIFKCDFHTDSTCVNPHVIRAESTIFIEVNEYAGVIGTVRLSSRPFLIRNAMLIARRTLRGYYNG